MKAKDFLALKNVYNETVETFSDRMGWGNIPLADLLEEFFETQTSEKTKTICQHCKSTLMDAELFNERCLKCGKKPI